MNPLNTIQTKQLLLRPLLESDVEEIFILRSDPEIGKFIVRPPQKGIAEAYAFIEKIKKLVTNNESYYWVIQLQDSPYCIGTICLWNLSEDRKTAEVGYDLMLEHHGKGIMSEALNAVLNFGFKTLQLNTIEAFTHRDNEASRKLLTRNGLVFQPDRDEPEFPHNVIFTIKK